MGETFALFHVAAGARLGYGHLRRALTMAAVLGRPSAVHIRGSAEIPRGVRRVDESPGRAVRTFDPRVVVVDDPRADAALAWVRAARRGAVPVVSVHDLGLAAVDSDLAVDGSLSSRRRWPARQALLGPRFAIVDPGLRRGRRRRVSPSVRTVAVSLGGGRHSQSLQVIAGVIRELLPDARVLVTAGLHGGRPVALPRGVERVSAPAGLRSLLERVDLAVLGGGTSLFEAAALGVPTVAVPVVPAQRRTIRAFARLGLTVPAGRYVADPRQRADQVGRAARTLATDRHLRWRMALRGPQVVDGRGAQRVAEAIHSLVETAHA